MARYACTAVRFTVCTTSVLAMTIVSPSFLLSGFFVLWFCRGNSRSSIKSAINSVATVVSSRSVVRLLSSDSAEDNCAAGSVLSSFVVGYFVIHFRIRFLILRDRFVMVVLLLILLRLALRLGWFCEKIWISVGMIGLIVFIFCNYYVLYFC